MISSRHNYFKALFFLAFVFLLHISTTFADNNMTATGDGTSKNTATSTTTLVVGATGATGKWVVKLLLDQNQNVKVVVRSKERMLNLLQEIIDDATSYNDRLTITEASLLDVSEEEWKKQVQDCDAVVSCLGHTMDFAGIWGRASKQLVTKATTRLTQAIAATSEPNKKRTKFILMGSDGVANPNGKDDKRSFLERTILAMLRVLVPPHPDNEGAAAVVHALGTSSNMEWTVIRPTDLIDGKPNGKYQLFEKPTGSLFGGGTATRANVAQCMVDLILQKDKWQQYKFQMPVLHDIPTQDKAAEL